MSFALSASIGVIGFGAIVAVWAWLSTERLLRAASKLRQRSRPGVEPHVQPRPEPG